MIVYYNYTPHPVRILSEACAAYNKRKGWVLVKKMEPAVLIEFKSIGSARCVYIERIADVWRGIPRYELRFDKIIGLPPSRQGVFLIVSSLVSIYARSEGRTDVLVPFRRVKNARGLVVGCLGFS